MYLCIYTEIYTKIYAKIYIYRYLFTIQFQMQIKVIGTGAKWKKDCSALVLNGKKAVRHWSLSYKNG